MVTGTGNGVINILLNNKYVKAIIIVFRSNTIATSATDRSLSTRAKANLIQYYFSINGHILPQTLVYLSPDTELLNGGLFFLAAGPPNTTQPGGDSRGFMQVQKIWNNVPGFNSTCSYGCNEFNSTGMALKSSLDAANPNLATDIAGWGAFFMGVNLESLTSETDLSEPLQL